MHNRSCIAALATVALLFCPLEAALAGSAGKADLGTVMPSGSMDSASGAPSSWPKPVHDNKLHRFLAINRLEYGDPDGPNNYLWDAEGWIGGDYNKLWIKSEGEGPIHGSGPESTEFQALYNRAISAFWGAQAGLRYDTSPNPDRVFAVLGLEGLAPYWLETDTALFISEDGDVSLRGEFQYALLLTQRLVLQPRIEVNISAQDVPRYGLGQGINDTEMGLRLRYAIRREFAPYIGVRWDQEYGETRDMARQAGDATTSTAFVLGAQAWY